MIVSYLRSFPRALPVKIAFVDFGHCQSSAVAEHGMEKGRELNAHHERPLRGPMERNAKPRPVGRVLWAVFHLEIRKVSRETVARTTQIFAVFTCSQESASPPAGARTFCRVDSGKVASMN